MLRRLYQRDHLSQVLGTFAILLMANERCGMIWGRQPIRLNPPPALAGRWSCCRFFLFRPMGLFIIAVGLLVALGLLYLLVTRTRWACRCGPVRPTAKWRWPWVSTCAICSPRCLVGAALCAHGWWLLGPMLAVQVGMGESILILAFVVIVIGGIGSMRGAFLGALLVGVVDTAGRSLIPPLFALLVPRRQPVRRPRWRPS
jgi:branched-chain amino acid transport system permease protein